MLLPHFSLPPSPLVPCSLLSFLVLIATFEGLLSHRQAGSVYYHIRAEAVRTSCSAIAITIKMSDKVSEVTKDSFVALAVDGGVGRH